MIDGSSFGDVIRAVAGELQREPPSPVHLNQAAVRIDQLGRRLHGLGWTREHEIGTSLTRAVGELSRARGLSEVERTESVREAIRHLEVVLAAIDSEPRPRQDEPVTELTAPEGIGDERR